MEYIKRIESGIRTTKRNGITRIFYYDSLLVKFSDLFIYLYNVPSDKTAMKIAMNDISHKYKLGYRIYTEYIANAKNSIMCEYEGKPYKLENKLMLKRRL